MGYSRSKKSIRRVEQYLNQLVASDSNIDFPSQDPVKFSYYLREGIRAAKEFATSPAGEPQEPFYSYAKLGTKYIIRVKGMIVSCELRDVMPIMKLKESLSTMSIPDVEDTLGIIGAAIKHKAPEMVFPAANEDSIDAPMLYNWAEHNGYYLVVADSHVTLTKSNPGELTWKP